MKEKTVDRRINELDTKSLMKMDTRELCLLLEQANPEQRKRLLNILNSAAVEQGIREIVREELAAATIKRAAKGGRGWITEDPAMVRAYKRAAKRGPESIARFTAKMFRAEKGGIGIHEAAKK